MRIVVDANVALRAFYPPDPGHDAALAALRRLVLEGHELLRTPQVMREVDHTCMRPVPSNGLGLDVAEARAVLARIEEGPLALLNDTPRVYEEWRRPIDTVEIRGRQTHDANHAAALRAHGVSHLLTLDPRDFARDPDLTVLTPQTVLA